RHACITHRYSVFQIARSHQNPLSLHDALPISTDAGLGAAQYVGLNLDVGRKAFSADGVVELLGRMAELGFTALHLHLTETHRVGDRKSTRLNSSHVSISYAVFCLKKKKLAHNH